MRLVTDENAEQIDPIELIELFRSFTMMLYEKDLITTSDKEWLFEQITKVVDNG